MSLNLSTLFANVSCLYCPEFDSGYREFNSWNEFLDCYKNHNKSNHKPLYAFKINISDASEGHKNLFVIPWDDLENYL